MEYRRNPFLPAIDSKTTPKKPDKKDAKLIEKPKFEEPKKINE